MSGKRSLSAKELVTDIRAGATDAFLMKKYGISERALQSLLNKLVAAKALTPADIDNRESAEKEPITEQTKVTQPSGPLAERVIENREDAAAWRCPNCHKSQVKPVDVCPACGIIVNKPRAEKTLESTPQIPVKEPISEKRKEKSFRPNSTKQRLSISASDYRLLILLAGIIFIVTTIFHLGLGALLYIIFGILIVCSRRLSPQMQEFSPLPLTFLELVGPVRKRALDLAWASLLGEIVGNVVNQVSEGARWSVQILCFVFSALFFFVGLLLNTSFFDRKFPDPDYPDAALFLLLLLLYSIALALLHRGLRVRQNLQCEIEKNLRQDAEAMKLKGLALNFISDQYQEWLQRVTEIGTARSKDPNEFRA